MHTRLRLQLSTSEPFTPLRQRAIFSDNSVPPTFFDETSPGDAAAAAARDNRQTPGRNVNGEGARVFSSGLLFNVGMLPRTWQDESYANPAMNPAFTDDDYNVRLRARRIVAARKDEVTPILYGNGRPLTAVEVGCCVIAGGEVRRVKPIGALAVVDLFEDTIGRDKGYMSSELAVVVVDQEDEWARELWTLQDLEERAPGTLDGIR